MWGQLVQSWQNKEQRRSDWKSWELLTGKDIVKQEDMAEILEDPVHALAQPLHTA